MEQDPRARTLDACALKIATEVSPMDGVLAADTDESNWIPLIDVSGVPIRDLIGQTDTVFARVIQQVIVSLDDPNGVISAFQSFAATT
jgi:hypothetical protein